MSHRTIRKHPHEEWRKWQAAGLRFIADREFNTEPFTSQGVVTDRVLKVDLQDFTNALDWASEGYPDDDNLAPRSVFEDTPSVDIMPDFAGDTHESERIYYAHAWNRNYNDRNSSEFQASTWRDWCVMNLLVMLDDRNLEDSHRNAGVVGNAEYYGDIVDSNFIQSFESNYGSINPYTATFGGAFGAWYLTDETTLPSTQWVDPAERDRRLDLIDSILGDATVRA